MQKILMPSQVSDLLYNYDKDILKVLDGVDGYYECPKDAEGNRLGPLVGYTATYGEGLHWVGDAYLNFAKMEHYPKLTCHFARLLGAEIIKKVGRVNVFMAAPEGGKSVAEMLAYVSGARYVYPEKEIHALKTVTAREKSSWKWGRHDGHILPDEKVVICEDLMNNFATTMSLLELAWKCGVKVVGLAGWYNRSVKYRDAYPLDGGDGIPIITLGNKTLPEYKQDDPFVAKDVEAGNVSWKPKHDWDRLKKVMMQI